MKHFFRTEVLTQIFLSRIKPSGGHVDLLAQSIDWIRAPLVSFESSCVCLSEKTEYVIGLFNSMGLHVAVIGYDVIENSYVVRQLQGLFSGDGLIPRGWERTLLGTLVQVARLSCIEAVEVIPSWRNVWRKHHNADPELKEQLRRRYDATPQMLGFTLALPGSDENHVFRVT